MSACERLLSIVVPTRNRAQYASALIRGLHASPSPDFELIIQDNSDLPDLRERVLELNDPRFHYEHTSEPLNMHQNFDRAIAKANGTYVCALGDDDGILIDEALAVLGRADAKSNDAVLTEILIYNWPGLRHWFWGDSGGRMAGATLSGHRELLLDPRQELKRVFGAGVTTGLGMLPRVYQGFVARRSLLALHQRCGTCFPGASPDIANAVGLVPFVNSIRYSPKPAIISGHSPKSGGGAGAAGRHHGRLEDQAHLPVGTLESWDPSIPRFWSGVTIYAHSAVVAAKASSAEAPPPMAHHRLYAACLVYEPRRYWGSIAHAAGAEPGRKLGLALRTLSWAAYTAILRGARFAKAVVLRRIGSRAEQHQTMAGLMAARAGARGISRRGRSA